uniref:uncharacterized protein LOC120884233 n=1 Tax=Ictidomys tridecemlineatus TaxID=43179 RepID=UPI001A9D3588|nr:uncharacterized protein LOC120884233 [Ictidomys tridecemlineatus]
MFSCFPCGFSYFPCGGRLFRRPHRQSSPYGCTAPSPDPNPRMARRRNIMVRMGCWWRSCSHHLCPCVNRQGRPTRNNRGPLRQRPSTTDLMEDSNRGFQSRAVLEGPGPSTSGNELGLRAQSPESLEDTLEPDCLDEDSSFTSSTSSSSTKEETDVMWRRVMSSLIGIQRLHNPARNIHCHVYVTDHDLEYEDHHIQGFIENPEPMEGKAKWPLLVTEETTGQFPPSGRALQLETPEMSSPGQQLLVTPPPAKPTELPPIPIPTPEVLLRSPGIYFLIIFIVCIYLYFY